MLNQMEKHPLHLKNTELQKSPEVERAVKREEHLSGEKIPNDPGERIETYMDRLEDVFLNEDDRVRERNIDLLRPKIHDALLIKPENVPDSYFELQQRIARERGQPVERIPEDTRREMIDTVIEDQRHSLDAWIDYLTSDDAVYPAWFKYLAWNNIIKLSQFDKERGEFKKRTSSTVAPFPDIYREPLAQMADVYEKIKEDNKQLSEPEIKKAFEKKFPALYAELIQKSLAASIESRENIEGDWIKYSQGEEGAAEKLYQSLEGKGTGWCTAGRSTAETQIAFGDFYVYYTYDKSCTPTQPRLAIRMNGTSQIGEVRGILPHQNVEPALQSILDEKLGTFGPEADRYKKKSEDMKKLTEIDEKCFKRDQKTGEVTEQLDPTLTTEELRFLYEIDAPIEGFGYGHDKRIEQILSNRNRRLDARILFQKTNLVEDKIKNGEKLSKENLEYLYETKMPAQGFLHSPDPRIAELLSERSVAEDLSTIFECSPSYIAYSRAEVSESTQVYIGPLEPKIFDVLPTPLKGMYRSFPREPVNLVHLGPDLETRNGSAYEKAMDKKGIWIHDNGEKFLQKTDFKIPESSYNIELVIVGLDKLVGSLEKRGHRGTVTLDEMRRCAEELGLELCPAELAPKLRLQYLDQPVDDWLILGTEPLISSSDDGEERERLIALCNQDGLGLTSHPTNNGGWSRRLSVALLRPIRNP